jgi:hypothetical protein
MRTIRVLGAILASGLALGMAACTDDNKSEFRSGIEDGFESAGLDATDEQIDCLADSIIEKVGGEDRLDELESEFDSVDDLPEDVQAEFTTAATESFEECEIDPTATTGG